MEHGHYSFNDEEAALLGKRRLEWQAADRPQRRVIATEVYEFMKKQNPEWDKSTKKVKKDVRMCGTFVIYLLNRCPSGSTLVVPYLWEKTGFSGTFRCSQEVECPHGCRR